jgi:hypothetical protein
MALVRFQAEYERFLRASGYTVSPVSDRRREANGVRIRAAIAGALDSFHSANALGVLA